MRLLIAAVALIAVFSFVLVLRLKWMKQIPNISQKAILDAFASRIILDFILIFLMVWSYARYGIPEYILMSRSITTIAMAAIVLTYLAIWKYLLWKFKSTGTMDTGKQVAS